MWRPSDFGDREQTSGYTCGKLLHQSGQKETVGENTQNLHLKTECLLLAKLNVSIPMALAVATQALAAGVL
jgi:hypothetical protein